MGHLAKRLRGHKKGQRKHDIQQERNDRAAAGVEGYTHKDFTPYQIETYAENQATALELDNRMNTYASNMTSEQYTASLKILQVERRKVVVLANAALIKNPAFSQVIDKAALASLAARIKAQPKLSGTNERSQLELTQEEAALADACYDNIHIADAIEEKLSAKRGSYLENKYEYNRQMTESYNQFSFEANALLDSRQAAADRAALQSYTADQFVQDYPHFTKEQREATLAIAGLPVTTKTAAKELASITPAQQAVIVAAFSADRARQYAILQDPNAMPEDIASLSGNHAALKADRIAYTQMNYYADHYEALRNNTKAFTKAQGALKRNQELREEHAESKRLTVAADKVTNDIKNAKEREIKKLTKDAEALEAQNDGRPVGIAATLPKPPVKALPVTPAPKAPQVKSAAESLTGSSNAELVSAAKQLSANKPKVKTAIVSVKVEKAEKARVAAVATAQLDQDETVAIAALEARIETAQKGAADKASAAKAKAATVTAKPLATPTPSTAKHTTPALLVPVTPPVKHAQLVPAAVSKTAYTPKPAPSKPVVKAPSPVAPVPTVTQAPVLKRSEGGVAVPEFFTGMPVPAAPTRLAPPAPVSKAAMPTPPPARGLMAKELDAMAVEKKAPSFLERLRNRIKK